MRIVLSLNFKLDKYICHLSRTEELVGAEPVSEVEGNKDSEHDG